MEREADVGVPNQANHMNQQKLRRVLSPWAEVCLVTLDLQLLGQVGPLLLRVRSQWWPVGSQSLGAGIFLAWFDSQNRCTRNRVCLADEEAESQKQSLATKQQLTEQEDRFPGLALLLSENLVDGCIW